MSNSIGVITGEWRNKKHGTVYVVTGSRINSTNANNGQVMIDYTQRSSVNGALKVPNYCREVNEFLEKFEKI